MTAEMPHFLYSSEAAFFNASQVPTKPAWGSERWSFRLKLLTLWSQFVTGASPPETETGEQCWPLDYEVMYEHACNATVTLLMDLPFPLSSMTGAKDWNGLL